MEVLPVCIFVVVTPVGQLVQVAAVAPVELEYEPALQGEQNVAAPVEYKPRAQAAQSDTDVSPDNAELVPGGQGWQVQIEL